MVEKSILMSASPNECCNTLNLLQSLFVRKKFPKDFVGWVYIYCTKAKPTILGKAYSVDEVKMGIPVLNGKVVARFWCDKVEGIFNIWEKGKYEGTITPKTKTFSLKQEELTNKSCLSIEELRNYIKKSLYKCGYAIHIGKLEIFDKPKELSEFDRPCQHWDNEHQCYSSDLVCCAKSCKFYKNTKLVKAPKSWQFIYGGK